MCIFNLYAYEDEWRTKEKKSSETFAILSFRNISINTYFITWNYLIIIIFYWFITKIISSGARETPQSKQRLNTNTKIWKFKHDPTRKFEIWNSTIPHWKCTIYSHPTRRRAWLMVPLSEKNRPHQTRLRAATAHAIVVPRRHRKSTPWKTPENSRTRRGKTLYTRPQRARSPFSRSYGPCPCIYMDTTWLMVGQLMVFVSFFKSWLAIWKFHFFAVISCSVNVSNLWWLWWSMNFSIICNTFVVKIALHTHE